MEDENTKTNEGLRQVNDAREKLIDFFEGKKAGDPIVVAATDIIEEEFSSSNASYTERTFVEKLSEADKRPNKEGDIEIERLKIQLTTDKILARIAQIQIDRNIADIPGYAEARITLNSTINKLSNYCVSAGTDPELSKHEATAIFNQAYQKGFANRVKTPSTP
jgi:hypothetical protein